MEETVKILYKGVKFLYRDMVVLWGQFIDMYIVGSGGTGGVLIIRENGYIYED